MCKILLVCFISSFGEDDNLIKMQEMYLKPLFSKDKDTGVETCVATTESIEWVFLRLTNF